MSIDYQHSLEQTHGTHNVRTLFGVHEIPSDNQIRTLLDATPPERLGSVPDYRQAQEKLYDLPHILLFSILAVMSGATSYRKIHQFICPHQEGHRALNSPGSSKSSPD